VPLHVRRIRLHSLQLEIRVAPLHPVLHPFPPVSVLDSVWLPTLTLNSAVLPLYLLIWFI
jgi:hypothetical protein